jgi:hypothetical protein
MPGTGTGAQANVVTPGTFACALSYQLLAAARSFAYLSGCDIAWSNAFGCAHSTAGAAQHTAGPCPLPAVFKMLHCLLGIG